MNSIFLTEAIAEAQNNLGSSIDFDKDSFEITVTEVDGITKTARFNHPPTEECYRLAINTGWQEKEIQFIKKLQNHDNPNESLEAVKYSGYLLKYVKTQTPQICLEAIESDSDCFMFISIVEFTDLNDCIKKLEAKLKLEKLINETI